MLAPSFPTRLPRHGSRSRSAGTTEDAILAWLATQRDAIVGLLGQLVNVDSDSHDKRGIDRVGTSWRTAPRNPGSSEYRAAVPRRRAWGSSPIAPAGADTS